MCPSVCRPSARPLATIHGVPGTWTRSSALVNPQMNVRPAAGSHAACAAAGSEIAMRARTMMDSLLKPMAMAIPSWSWRTCGGGGLQRAQSRTGRGPTGSDKFDAIAMDSPITAAARALAMGDPPGAPTNSRSKPATPAHARFNVGLICSHFEQKWWLVETLCQPSDRKRPCLVTRCRVIHFLTHVGDYPAASSVILCQVMDRTGFENEIVRASCWSFQPELEAAYTAC